MKEANGFTCMCPPGPAMTRPNNFVFAPGDGGGLVLAEQFARKSGWQALSEYDGAVLILPLAPEGWNAQSHSLPGSIYDRVRGQVGSRNGGVCLAGKESSGAGRPCSTWLGMRTGRFLPEIVRWRNRTALPRLL